MRAGRYRQGIKLELQDERFGIKYAKYAKKASGLKIKYAKNIAQIRVPKRRSITCT